jgi:hypothetical protein
MKRKNAFWLSLVFAITFACAPMLVQAAPQDTPPPPPQALQDMPPLPSPPRADQDQRDAQRTITGPYRLTYTMTEMDGTKRVGSQRYAIVLDADARPSHVNLQSSIPVEVISAPGFSSKHIDRMKEEARIDANLRQFANGMELSTQVQQDTFARGTNDGPATDVLPPVTRESFLTTTVLLSENKPVTIGQLDIPGSTHVLQIQVELTKLP